jgi:aryl-alcohol dehydrogenase-like predicted oxidoreductase
MTVKLVIGGAQFGAVYGIANTTGAPAPEAVRHILRLARDTGVSWIDTARAYPGSEAAIGEALLELDGWRPQITTKLPPLGENQSALAAIIRGSLTESRRLLRTDRLDAVLLHRWENFGRENGLVDEIMREEQVAGRIGVFGVSVQTPEELEEALRVETIGHIQLPFNILDHRWDAVIPEIRRVRRQRTLCVHVRSLLLQGLLISNNADHWLRAHVPDSGPVRHWLRQQVRACCRRNLQDLCFSWGRAQDWIDGLVVGAETPSQMAENLRNCTTPLLSRKEVDDILISRSKLAEHTLNPAQWEP